MNITDVDEQDDPRLSRSRCALKEFTAHSAGVLRDLETLRIKRADDFPSATDPKHIAAMIEMIKTLIVRSLAYRRRTSPFIFGSTNSRNTDA